MTHKYLARSAARLCAVQLVYAHHVDPDQYALLMDNAYYTQMFLGDDAGVEPDRDFVIRLVDGTLREKPVLLQAINAALDGSWPFERMEKLMQSLFEVAAYETIFCQDTDGPIIISEYVDVVHAFYGKKEFSFVNGALHTLMQNVRAA